MLFKEWAEFRQLCGRVWVMGSSGHGPRSVFKAKVDGIADSDQVIASVELYLNFLARIVD